MSKKAAPAWRSKPIKGPVVFAHDDIDPDAVTLETFDAFSREMTRRCRLADKAAWWLPGGDRRNGSNRHFTESAHMHIHATATLLELCATKRLLREALARIQELEGRPSDD